MDLFVDGKIVASTSADRQRKHGDADLPDRFVFDVVDEIRDAVEQRAEISVKISGDGYELTNSPWSFDESVK